MHGNDAIDYDTIGQPAATCPRCECDTMRHGECWECGFGAGAVEPAAAQLRRQILMGGAPRREATRILTAPNARGRAAWQMTFAASERRRNARGVVRVCLMLAKLARLDGVTLPA